MEIEKIRNLSDGEIQQQERQSAEQIFRLRFQTKLGQTEGVKKLRQLKTDIARLKTIAREREIGVHGATPKTTATLPVKAQKADKKTNARKTKKEAR